MEEFRGLKGTEVLLSCPYHPVRDDWPERHMLHAEHLLNTKFEGGQEYVSLE